MPATTRMYKTPEEEHAMHIKQGNLYPVTDWHRRMGDKLDLWRQLYPCRTGKSWKGWKLRNTYTESELAALKAEAIQMWVDCSDDMEEPREMGTFYSPKQQRKLVIVG
tara:strand:- start:4 stop:327 length:324 start_codon:yes stop_codon:yes gene_type:complete